MSYRIASTMPETIEYMGAELPVKWFLSCAAKYGNLHCSVNTRGERDYTGLVLDSIALAYERQLSLRQGGKPELTGKPDAYLYCCVRNLVRDAARKHLRHTRRECTLEPERK